MAKVRLPRRGKYEGETFFLVKDRDGYNPKCKACGEVVPVSVWWKHQCSKASEGKLSQSDGASITSKVTDGEP